MFPNFCRYSFHGGHCHRPRSTDCNRPRHSSWPPGDCTESRTARAPLAQAAAGHLAEHVTLGQGDNSFRGQRARLQACQISSRSLETLVSGAQESWLTTTSSSMRTPPFPGEVYPGLDGHDHVLLEPVLGFRRLRALAPSSGPPCRASGPSPWVNLLSELALVDHLWPRCRQDRAPTGDALLGWPGTHALRLRLRRTLE